MKHIVADIETNGLLEQLTTIHSLVLRDVDTGEVVSCANQPGYVPIEDGLRMVQQAERVYFHNGIKFDIPAIRKIYPWWTIDREKIRDTLIIAQMRWAHIRDLDFKRKSFPKKFAGSHALEAWGYRLGVYKGEYTDWCKQQGIADPWAAWCPEMQTYCEGDTDTTRALVQAIRNAGVSQESIDIEHELAWYLAAQERAGVPFDMEKAVALQGKLAARREEIAEQMRQEFGPRYKPSGQPVIPKRDNAKKGVVAGAAYQKIELHEFNPGSRQDIEFKLRDLFGWVPDDFTDSGQAKIDEKTLKGLNADVPAVKLLLEYLMVAKRLGMLAEGKESWLQHARADAPEGGKLTGCIHIHGRIKQNHAITHRASHVKPNLSQVPKVGKPFGAECRELFYVPQVPGLPDDEQWVLVGADASSLEARCLAHYMAAFDDGAYGKLLLEGDVHTANRIALGLPGDTELIAKVARDGSKTWYYAFMYGGGDFKLGSILVFLCTPDGARLLPIPKGGWTEGKIKKLGAEKKAEFLTNTPALKALIESVKRKAKTSGWLRMPDGRRTYIRSDHSALNSLLQSAGAIIVKRWIASFAPKVWAQLGEPGWNGQWVPLLWSHDEVQIAVKRKHAAWLQELLVTEMRNITTHFAWRVQLDGEAKMGLNWKDTH